ncbi:MAG: hypothetical protein RMJ17_02400 [Candidatus Aenigmarchaeota archaeon]|nr:hypothetical protein [Candidatus Aenigmarchaeota archaeon]MDW8149423.1 hypothetical protein [Candidatus Aenigmarchaeota archaeon]
MLSTDEIIREFANRGYVLTPEALEYLKNFDSLEEIIRNIQKEKIEDKCITIDLLSKMIRKQEVEVIENDFKVGEITIECLNKLILERFEFLKGFLKNKIEMVNVLSIANLKKSEKKGGSIIAIVVEVCENSIVVEDYTGTIRLNFNINEKIFPGDVLGFLVSNYEVKKIIYPDIPLLVSKKSNENVFIRFGYECDEVPKEDNYYFFNNKMNSKKTIVFGDYLKVRIEKNFLVLIVNESLIKIEKNFETEMLSLLKKRNLNPLIMEFPSNALFLKDIPDFIVVFGKNFDTHYFNYKGVSVIYIKENTFFDIDLKTREIYKNK